MNIFVRPLNPRVALGISDFHVGKMITRTRSYRPCLVPTNQRMRPSVRVKWAGQDPITWRGMLALGDATTDSCRARVEAARCRFVVGDKTNCSGDSHQCYVNIQPLPTSPWPLPSTPRKHTHSPRRRKPSSVIERTTCKWGFWRRTGRGCPRRGKARGAGVVCAGSRAKQSIRTKQPAKIDGPWS